MAEARDRMGMNARKKVQRSTFVRDGLDDEAGKRAKRDSGFAHIVAGYRLDNCRDQNGNGCDLHFV